MDWSIIKKENLSYFEKNPLSEIIISYLFKEKRNNKLNYTLRNNFRLFLLILYCLLNPFREKKFLKKIDGIVLAQHSRANNWGIIFPIVKYLDSKGVSILFVIDKACLKYKKELNALKNTQWILSNKILTIKGGRLKVSYFFEVFKAYKRDKIILEKFHLKNKASYFFNYLAKLVRNNKINEVYSKSAKFSISLGDRNFGMLYQLFNVKHFVMQHGHKSEATLKECSRFTGANNFATLVFGDYYKTMFDKIFPNTNTLALGNPYYDKFVCNKPVKESKNIIFFSATHGFTNGKFKIHSHEDRKKIVDTTLNELLDLYKKVDKSYKIKVKLHPNEESSYYLSYNDLFGTEIEIIDGSVNSIDILLESAVAISWFSTTNLEAMVLDVLAVQLIKDPNKFAQQDFSFKVNNLDELLTVINCNEKLQELKRHQKKLLVNYLKNLGNSTEIIGNYIIEQINIV